jgi:hypothetical protein
LFSTLLAVLEAIEKKLSNWQHLESILGPRAMVRLLSVTGRTPYTENWWGNGWWPDLCQQVVATIAGHDIEIPASYAYAGNSSSSQLGHLLDPPEGEGLRWGKTKILEVEIAGSRQ